MALNGLKVIFECQDNRFWKILNSEFFLSSGYCPHGSKRLPTSIPLVLMERDLLFCLCVTVGVICSVPERFDWPKFRRNFFLPARSVHS